MNSRFEVEGAAFEEGSSGGDNRSGFLCTKNSRRLSCSASKKIQFSEVFDRTCICGEIGCVGNVEGK